MDRRRTSVPFDLYFFEKQQRDTFERIYATNLTTDTMLRGHSFSGPTAL